MLVLMEQINDGGANIDANEVAGCPVFFKEAFSAWKSRLFMVKRR